jgi:2-keto-3-deoxy-L-rhamnonate aldolase RhmA
MRTNRAKAKIVNGELALNGFFYLPDPITVELMGQAGYDAVSMDLQHMAWGLDRVRMLIMAAELAGVSPIVRIAPGDWGTALKVLDAGAQGIMVSHVHSLEIAKAAVDAVRYAPLGDRGAHSYTRASGFGSTPYKEHTASSNEEILLVLTIEDAPGLDIVEDIAALDGVDVITFGPHDLAESMGIRDAGDPRVREAITTAVGKVRDVGKARFGLPIH